MSSRGRDGGRMGGPAAGRRGRRRPRWRRGRPSAGDRIRWWPRGRRGCPAPAVRPGRRRQRRRCRPAPDGRPGGHQGRGRRGRGRSRRRCVVARGLSMSCGIDCLEQLFRVEKRRAMGPLLPDGLRTLGGTGTLPQRQPTTSPTGTGLPPQPQNRHLADRQGTPASVASIRFMGDGAAAGVSVGSAAPVRRARPCRPRAPTRAKLPPRRQTGGAGFRGLDPVHA